MIIPDVEFPEGRQIRPDPQPQGRGYPRDAGLPNLNHCGKGVATTNFCRRKVLRQIEQPACTVHPLAPFRRAPQKTECRWRHRFPECGELLEAKFAPNAKRWIAHDKAQENAFPATASAYDGGDLPLVEFKVRDFNSHLSPRAVLLHSTGKMEFRDG